MSLIKKYLYLTPVLLFLGSLGNFFASDDWFHLRISQISSFGEFLNFFSFSNTAQSAAFYRPLPTQLFFYVFQGIFGLTAWPYHLFVLICFGYSLYLIKKFSSVYLKSEISQLITVLIYGLSVSNFTRLYFLSAFQEISLVIFSLLCLLNFPKSKLKSAIFFVLALMSKETAIVLPLLLFVFNIKDFKKIIISLIPIAAISLVYLYFRFVILGSPVGDSYVWNFSPVKAANTLMWYTLWSFGAPELLVDYVGSGLRLVPKFFVDYPLWGKVIIHLLGGTILTSAVLFAQKARELGREWLKFILLFIISLLPVLFLPSHKFALELGLPLVGFAMAIAWLMPKKLNIFAFAFLSFYFCLNLSMNYLTYTRHYSVSRGEISQKVYNYVSENYPTHPKDQYFEFVNDSKDFGSEWGQSKQISQALSGSDFFKVYYHTPSAKVYYEDITEERPSAPGVSVILLSTNKFLTNE